ncbi:hypothetical protein [Streptomyces sp. NPDC054784]
MADSSGIGGGTAGATGGTGTVHEEYSFACMKCGHGWEQTYDIQHHLPPDGTPFVTYWTEGHRVPSPLTNPTCVNCDGHLLRIMRSGRVALAERAMHT